MKKQFSIDERIEFFNQELRSAKAELEYRTVVLMKRIKYITEKLESLNQEKTETKEKP